MPRVRSLVLILAAFVALLLEAPGTAHADARPRLPIAHEMRSVKLGKYISILKDDTGNLGIDDVASPDRAKDFAANRHDAPGFGFSKATYWVRLDVQNPMPEAAEWLLEVAYPSLDFVDLYVPRPDGGYDKRLAGDMLSFSVRDVDYRNVVFKINGEPGADTYYLRIQSSGSISIPLVAWTTHEFLTSLNTELPVLWMFYGLMLVMAIYNGFIYSSVRQREYLFYSLYIGSYALFQMTLNGHTSQYLFPDYVRVANRLLPFAIGSSFFWSCCFHRAYLSLNEQLPRVDAWLRRGSYVMGATTVLSIVAPYALSIRLTVLFGIILTLIMLGSAFRLVARRYRPAQLYTLAWCFFHLGILLFLLKTVGVLPETFMTTWSLQIGASIEVVLLSLALADRINLMRANLAELNVKLSNNVDVLTAALGKAEAGARAKTNFLAMISHELRTPLNAIINIPEGLIEQFPSVSAASCSQCKSVFELEPGDDFDGHHPCPSCGATGTLQQEKLHRYEGDADTAVQHLSFVERSGRHLLQVVNGILDYSKLEAGRLDIDPADVDVSEVIAETAGPLAQLAMQKGVTLTVGSVPKAMLHCDRLRLSQIIINLVGNAIKFSEAPSTVRIDVEQQDKTFLFSVSDEGIGIPAEHREKVFESFEQVLQGSNRRYGGTGLGLTISRALVEMHGGRIWAEGRNGPGSVFKFELPRLVSPVRSSRAVRRRSARPDSAPPPSANHGGMS